MVVRERQRGAWDEPALGKVTVARVRRRVSCCSACSARWWTCGPSLLWFREVDYSQVFTGVLFTRVGLFFAFGLAMALIVADQSCPRLPAAPVVASPLSGAGFPRAVPDGGDAAGRHVDRALFSALVGAVHRAVRRRAVGVDWMMFRHGGEVRLGRPLPQGQRRASTSSSTRSSASCSGWASPRSWSPAAEHAGDVLPLRGSSSARPR